MSTNAGQREDGFIAPEKGARFLKGWRQGMNLSQEKSASLLGVSTRMYAYYESGSKDLPVKVFLACHALSKGQQERMSLPRDRWVALVDNVHRYVAGEEVVGRMVRNKEWQALRDLMDAVKTADAELAMTDPALFQAMRQAGTKAYLSGLMMFNGPSIELIESLDDLPAIAP